MEDIERLLQVLESRDVDGIMQFMQNMPTKRRPTPQHAPPEIYRYGEAWVAGPYETRRLCVTSSGFLGQVPRVARVGDAVCIFLGSCVSHVLRRKEGVTFRPVGNVYIHSIMRG